MAHFGQEGQGEQGASTAPNAKQIAKRTCLLIMEQWEDSVAGVFFHHRHAEGPEQLGEQACYWLLKCGGGTGPGGSRELR